MGSFSLGKVIKNTGTGKIIKHYSNYEGCVVVIDTFQWLYKFKLSLLENTNDGHIIGLWNRVIKMLDNGILPSFVIDGKPPLLKRNILDKRRSIKNKAKTCLEKLDDSMANNSEKLRLTRRAITISSKEVQDVKQLLDDIGLPYIQAIGEADPQCAGMNIANKAHAVISDDWDLLIFGSRTVVTNFVNKKFIVEYNLNSILSKLELNYEQFVELAIVLGCDYCEPIRCINYNKKYAVNDLYEQYKKHKNINSLIQSLKNINSNRKKNHKPIKYIIPSDFINKWKDVKEYFLESKIYDPHSQENFMWNNPKYEVIEKKLIDTYKMPINLVGRHINKLKRIRKYYLSYGTIINFNKKNMKKIN